MTLTKPALFTSLPVLLAALFTLMSACDEVWAQSDSDAFLAVQQSVVICPYVQNSVPPSFSEPDCQKAPFYTLDAQNRRLWVQAKLLVTDDWLQLAEPLGLFVSGKAASQVSINGNDLGQNGVPGDSPMLETPGKMDAVFYLDKGLLRVGENTVVLNVSGHHGFLTLKRPMHNLGLAVYANPTHLTLTHYWRSLIPLGVLLLAVMYFSVLAWSRTPRTPHLLLPLMSFMVAVQLCAEVSRGLIGYAYPFHDVRLTTILLCSIGFGLCVVAYVLNRLALAHKKRFFTAVSGVVMLLVIVVPGFDYKSALAFLVPLLFALTVAIYKSAQKHPEAPFFVGGIMVFLSFVIAAPWFFLDVYFFYIVAGFILFLFVQQSQALAREHVLKVKERARADKLQLVIDQNQLAAVNPTIGVKSAGKTEWVAIREIIYCQGAGDYVELVLASGAKLLHSDTLSEMEATLPSTFLRVHRSFIVNTADVLTVERKASGTGLLSLSNGDLIPVSRRIMPSVRERLQSGL